MRRLLLFLVLLVPLMSTEAVALAQERDGLEDVPMEQLREAMRSWDGLAQAWFRLRAGDAEGARLDARRLLRERPRDPDALHVLGIAASAEGRDLQARRVLTRSLRVRPDGWVGVHLVNLHLDAGRIAAADKVVRDLERTLAGHAEVRRARAYVLVARGDLAGALAALESLEEVEPTAAVAHQLAILLAELGDDRAALAAARRAVQREPDNGAWRRELFVRLEAAGEWEELVAATSEAGSAEAGGGLDLYYRGLGLARLDRGAEAVSALSSVVEHGEPSPAALAATAGHLLQLGAYEPAERAARAAMAGREEEASLHHLLAMVLSRQNRESEALAHYRRAAETRADDATWRFDLLVSLCSLQRSAELEEALLRAKRDFPEDPRFEALAERCPEPPNS